MCNYHGIFYELHLFSEFGSVSLCAFKGVRKGRIQILKNPTLPVLSVTE